MKTSSSSSALSLPILDIDSEDKENPQLVGEYVNEIYCYMRQLEAEQNIKQDYLRTVKSKLFFLNIILRCVLNLYFYFQRQLSPGCAT